MVLGLVLQAGVYWPLVLVLKEPRVGLLACAVWWLAGAVAWLALGWLPAARWRALQWLEVLVAALIFAAVFRGASFALDALHGAHRPKSDVASHLGHVELWLVLCPGVVSVAAAGGVVAFITRRAR